MSEDRPLVGIDVGSCSVSVVVGSLEEDRLVVLGLHRESRCFRIEANDELVPTIDDAALTDLAVAYFQTAFELFQSGRYQLPPADGMAIAMARRPLR